MKQKWEIANPKAIRKIFLLKNLLLGATIAAIITVKMFLEINNAPTFCDFFNQSISITERQISIKQ